MGSVQTYETVHMATDGNSCICVFLANAADVIKWVHNPITNDFVVVAIANSHDMNSIICLH